MREGHTIFSGLESARIILFYKGKGYKKEYGKNGFKPIVSGWKDACQGLDRVVESIVTVL